jgi:predicted nucleotidyltransferase
VILFGSLASGTGPVDDIDLIAVMPTDLPFVERTSSLFERIDSAESVDLLVYTPAEFDEMASSSALIMMALSTGVTLHEKPTGS